MTASHYQVLCSGSESVCPEFAVRIRSPRNVCKSRRKGGERWGQGSGPLPAPRPPGTQAGPEGLFPAGLKGRGCHLRRGGVAPGLCRVPV